MPAVSNTSPISNLAFIGRLNLLSEQFGAVWIPHAVEAELRKIPASSIRKEIEQAARAGWLQTRAASNTALISLLSVELHGGEAEAISLALELKPDWLLMDEREGRAAARRLWADSDRVFLESLSVRKRAGQITSVRSEIDGLRSRAGFFVDSELESAILKQAGE